MLATAQRNTALNQCYIASFMAMALVIFATSAYATGTPTPMGTVLCLVVDMFYGNLGRGLSTLAIIVVGVGATLGKVSWGLAVTVAVGIAVMGGAPTILSAIGMGGFGAC